VPFVAALQPGDPPQPGAWTIAVQGSQADLEPQTAETWSIGFDLEFPFAPGLQTSISYYDIYFKGTLGRPPVQDPQQLYQNYSQVVTIRPTADQIAALGALAPNSGGPAQVAQFLDGTPFVYQLIDFRTDNFGNTKLSGLDFSTSYRHVTAFGQIDAGISGNYQLSRRTQATSVAPFANDLRFGMGRLALQTTLGATIGDFRAQATWNRSAGFDVQRTANLPQDQVEEFNTVDLFFRYNVSGPGLLNDVALTLNVNNVADEEPPQYLLSGADGYTNGFTVGRLFILGVSKKF
jgi:iron complex outermembrane receptor protein